MDTGRQSDLIAMEAQSISTDVLMEKYAKEGERSKDDVRLRVARALALNEAEEHREYYEMLFLWAQQAGFVPAGRINSAAGAASGAKATLINCFVQPVGDSVSDSKDGKPGIYAALAEAAETMRRGGGVGYDFSAIRPCGALVQGTGSRASGPVPFMHLFNASCETVESAGARRGAQMGVLRCDHPDIEAFILAKKHGGLCNFNISVGATDAFLRAVETDGSFDLVHAAQPGQELISAGARQKEDGGWIYRTVRARDLWKLLMQATYAAAEPGILFLDQMNRENNLYYCEDIGATNPCGEQPLPDYACCCLGSINLAMLVANPFTPEATFNFETFSAIIQVAVRMLDNVLDVTAWPLAQQAQEATEKRRVGLGFLGLGDALVMLGLRYDSDDGREFAAGIARVLRDQSYRASIDLAAEKGAFPVLQSDAFLKGEFISRLPEDLRARIATTGIRNSHLLSIAPTGTIALAFADNASNGIEPAFAWSYQRLKRMADGTTHSYEVADHAWRLYNHLGFDASCLPRSFVTALELPAVEHMKMMQAVQPFIDTAISKTVNVPENYPFSEFESLYFDAWRAGLKGLATYRPNAVTGHVLSTGSSSLLPCDDVNPLSKQFDTRPIGDLDSVTSKVEYVTFEGRKTAYFSISFIEVEGTINGKTVAVERPFEFFMPAGQKSESQQWITTAMRLLSMAARSGGSIAEALADMREVVWDRGPVRCGHYQKADGSSVPMFHDSESAAFAFALQQVLIKRGFLDSVGNQIPVNVLAAHFRARRQMASQAAPMFDGITDQLHVLDDGNGKKCPECGAFGLHRIDGCDRCASCQYQGSCG